jgi:hypothetical protein
MDVENYFLLKMEERWRRFVSFVFQCSVEVFKDDFGGLDLISKTLLVRCIFGDVLIG